MAEKADCANDELRSMKEDLAQEKARNAALLQELERARHGKSLQHSFKCRVFFAGMCRFACGNIH